MRLDADKVTDSFACNKEKVYIFSWNIQRGFTWFSNERCEDYVKLFQNETAYEQAILDGFVCEESRQQLKELIDSGKNKLPAVDRVIAFIENGEKYWRKITVNNCFDEDGKCIDFLVHIELAIDKMDITSKFSYRVDYDDLTGIYNAGRFYDIVNQLIHEDEEKQYAIVYLDLDRFEVINELFGIEEGDRILQYIAKVFRQLKGIDFYYCRVISDKFAICVAYNKIEEVVSLIRKIDDCVAKYPIDFRLAPSFGIYRIEDKTIPISVMLDYAKMACRSVKGNIINNYAVYAEELRRRIMHEVEIEKDMEQALEEHQFKIFLQPKYDISTGKVIGAESLCRWMHPIKGMLSPREFISLFERNGFIIKLDRYMWEETCKMIRQWLDKGYDVKPVSVNVSRMHEYNDHFEEDIIGLIEKYQIPPRLIELELTESAYLSSEESIYNAMGRLKNRGLLFSVDDFGTGYSSLNMLKNIPVDIVKLDREFLNETTNNSKGRAIIRNMIALAGDLNIRVIAEGVESVEQAAFLLEMGCELAQGYYYSKPLSTDDFEERAYTDGDPVELNSMIQDVLGEKKKFVDEVNFFMSADDSVMTDHEKKILSDPNKLQKDLLLRAMKYRKVLLGVSNAMYEFRIPEHKAVVYYREKHKGSQGFVDDYEGFYENLVASADEEYKEILEKKVSLRALQEAYSSGEDTLDITYKEKDPINARSSYVRNVYILIGNEQGALQEVLLCIQRCVADNRVVQEMS